MAPIRSQPLGFKWSRFPSRRRRDDRPGLEMLEDRCLLAVAMGGSLGGDVGQPLLSPCDRLDLTGGFGIDERSLIFEGIRFVPVADAFVLETKPGADPAAVALELVEVVPDLDGLKLTAVIRDNIAYIERDSDADHPEVARANADDVRNSACEAVAWISPLFTDTETGSRVALTNELIVAFQPGADAESLLRGRFAGYSRLSGTADQYIVSLSVGGAGILREAELLGADPRVAWSSPNFYRLVTAASFVDDPGFATQWNLRNIGQTGGKPGADIGVTAAWDETTGSPDVVVAVLDVGVEWQHPDLQENMFVSAGEIAGNGFDDDGNGWVDDAFGWDFANNDPDPSPASSLDFHGTNIAGVIAAVGNNGLGVAGVAPRSKIMSLKVWNQGAPLIDSARVAQAIYYAAGRTKNGLGTWRGADILNMSFGTPQMATDPAVNQALDWAAANGRGGKGTPIFVAAGNNAGAYEPFYQVVDPSIYPPGLYKFEWRYSKDAIGGSAGEDAARLALVVMPDQTLVQFNSTSLPPGWTTGGNKPWLVDADSAHAMGLSRYSLRSGTIADGQTSSLFSPPILIQGGVMVYHASVSSEADRDGLELYMHSATGLVFGPFGPKSGVKSVSTDVSYPANLPSTIAVGASTAWDIRADYSQFGNELDIVAPGGDGEGGLVNLLTTDLVGPFGANAAPTPAGDYMPFSGTSAATPVAAGIAALMLAKNPSLSVAQIRQIMRDTADKIGPLDYDASGFNPFYGYGRVSAAKAVAAVPATNSAAVVSIAPLQQASENGPTPGIFKLTRTGNVSAPLEVSFSLSGTAVRELGFGNGDYLLLDPKAQFVKGSDSAFVAVLPINDAILEATETVVMTLLSGTGYAISPLQASALVTISDSRYPTFSGVADFVEPNQSQDIDSLSAWIGPGPLLGTRNLSVAVSLVSRGAPIPGLFSVSLDVPAVEIFVDADQNPNTGDVREGHVRGAEFRIDAKLTPYFSGTILDMGSGSQVQWNLVRLPWSDQDVFRFMGNNISCIGGVLCPHVDSAESVVMTGGFTVSNTNFTLVVPMAAIGNAPSVDVFAIATTLGSAISGSTANGDRSPNFGAIDAGTGRVVVRNPAPTSVVELRDPDYSGTFSALRARFVTIADQFSIALEFNQPISASDQGMGGLTNIIGLGNGIQNLRGEIYLDTDHNLLTGAWPMGGSIATWGGDVSLWFNLTSLLPQQMVLMQFSQAGADKLPFGGDRNDGRWSIENGTTLQFQASLGTFWAHLQFGGDNAASWIAQAPDGRMAAYVKTQFGANGVDYLPAVNWAVDTRTGLPLAPLAVQANPINFQTVPDIDQGALGIPASGVDLVAVNAGIVNENLVVTGVLSSWLQLDRGNVFSLYLDTDMNPATGNPIVNLLNGGARIGADYRIIITNEETVIDLELWPPLLVPTSHRALVVPAPSKGGLNQPGTFTVTIPLSEIGKPDQLQLFVSTGFFQTVGVTDVDIAPPSPLIINTQLQGTNQPPAAVNDTTQTTSGTGISIPVLANDIDPDGDVSKATVEIVSGALHGSVSVPDHRAVLYTPAGGFFGPDSFGYRVVDEQGRRSNAATVTITVHKVNRVPVAVNDSYVLLGSRLDVAKRDGVLANDSDIDLDSLTANVVVGPLAGTLSLQFDGSFSYVPNANFNGVDSFTYRARDGLADSDTATVTITRPDVSNIVVSSAADSGPGTLRSAIDAANSHAGLDRITFAIPGTAPHTIQLQSELPSITDAVSIDGSTQSGYTGQPIIELNGSGAGEVDGLRIVGDGTTIRALVLNRFQHAAITVSGGKGNTIVGNYIGTDPSGTQAQANGIGVRLDAGSRSTRVGTDGDGTGDAAEANLIAGNTIGVLIEGLGTRDNRVAGNTIGKFDAQASILVPNTLGIVVMQQAQSNIIGTNGDGSGDAGEANLLVGNDLVGVLLLGNGTDLNVVAGNIILGNGAIGLWIANGAQRNRVGTDGNSTADLTERNIIVANGLRDASFEGVRISGPGTRDNIVAGNLIGIETTSASTAGNKGRGIFIGDQATRNVIGTNGDGFGDAVERNVISGNVKSGIEIADVGTVSNVVAGNYIGTNLSGSAAVPNGAAGIWIHGGAAGNRIGTDGNGSGDQAERNVIAGNTLQGVDIADADTNNNIVAGNFIGTDASGTLALGNQDAGVRIHAAAQANRIGANGDGIADEAERNVIAANRLSGIVIAGAGSDGNVIAGNYIGTDVTGLVARGNGNHGVFISDGAQSNRIGTNSDGTADPAERNLISGNSWSGIGVAGSGTNQNAIVGNWVGLNAAGTVALSNANHGVWIGFGAQSNRVGTDGNGNGDQAERNVVSGNGWSGIGISESNTSQNIVAGNFIGTDASGAVAVGNAQCGVLIYLGAQNNRVGTNGDARGDDDERNVISGNLLQGVNITNAGTDHNVVAGNTIGTDVTGTVALGNQDSGVWIHAGAKSNRIGTDGDGNGDATERNVIAASRYQGVVIWDSGTDANVVAGNLIGTNAAGTAALANGAAGVWIGKGARGNRIGTNADGLADTFERNVISGNSLQGVNISDAGTDQNIVAGNTIGTDVTGVAALGNQDSGVWVHAGARSNRIGTDGDGVGDAEERNVIAANRYQGVVIWDAGTDGNVVAGNFIGTDITGAKELGNGASGVWVGKGARSNRIGTNGDHVADEAERNVISGNALEGVNITDPGTNQNAVAGNFIGTDVSGNAALGNGNAGVRIHQGPQSNRIGTDGNGLADSAERNIISGNEHGVVIWDAGTLDNLVAGNRIGTDSSGTRALGNNTYGVWIGNGAQVNRIGTNGDGQADAEERNVIAAAGTSSVKIEGLGTDRNIVAGNFIGTDATGKATLATPSSPGIGVEIGLRASSNRIGTDGNGIADLAEGNLISGNGIGVWILDDGTNQNTIAGNGIGTDATGFASLGNGMGVLVEYGPRGTTIGGRNPGLGNTIAYNTEGGVRVTDWASNHTEGTRIQGNSIYSNGGLGIDLSTQFEGDGITPNDPSDSDGGPSRLQNFPELLAIQTGSSTIVTGSLNSLPNTQFDIDLYASATTDPNSFRQGQRLIGVATIMTAADGTAAFTLVLPAATSAQQVITATATDPNGNTSEFSAALGISNLPPVAVADARVTDEDTVLSIPVLANDADPDGQLDPATVTIVHSAAHGTLVLDLADGRVTYVPFPNFFGSDSFTYAVKDRDGAASNVASVTVDVQATNDAPSLELPQTHWTSVEGTPLAIQAHATDPEGDEVSYDLSTNAPLGANIDPVTGVLTWIPSEGQGPNNITFSIRVTDNGTPAMSAERQITVFILEANALPVLTAIGPKTIAEGSVLDFNVSAVDSDLPANTLTYSAFGVPTGATFDTTTHSFRWTPTEIQGPGTYYVTFTVSDGAASVSELITITVTEVAAPPTIAAIGNRAVAEAQELVFTVSATDADLPVNTLTYSAMGLPVGASFDPVTRLFRWTPSETQGPGTFDITFAVHDGALGDSELITIAVSESNTAPVLATIGGRAIGEGQELVFTVSATDQDLPANMLTYSATGLPVGASFDPVTRLFRWTPSEAQGPGTFDITFAVHDGALGDSEMITIAVSESNTAPVLAAIGDRAIGEGQQLVFVVSAADQDLPANMLTYSATGLPVGASFDPVTRLFRWTPSEAQGPGTFDITFAVNDGALGDSEMITIAVSESNTAPVLATVGDRAIGEGQQLVFVVSAADQDLPVNTLTYSATGLPVGASFDPVTRLFRWTPSEAQGPGTFDITFAVNDGALGDSRRTSITVAEANSAPMLSAIADKSVNAGSVLAFVAAAQDADLPANSLSFSLDPGAPQGATIDRATGLFSWTPAIALVGDFSVTVRVTDDGSPSLSRFQAVRITVIAAPMPNPPTIIAISPDSGTAGDGITNAAAPAVTGRAEAGTSIDLFVDGVIRGTAPIDSGGNWSVPLTALPDGTYRLTATARSAAGISSSNSSPFQVTIDTVAPSLSVVLATDSGESATDRVTADGRVLIQSDQGSLSVLVDSIFVIPDPSGAVTVVWDGTHHVEAVATDPAGNVSRATLDFVLDRLAPTLNLRLISDTGSSNVDGRTRDGRVQVSSNGNALSARLDGVLHSVDSNGIVRVTSDGAHRVEVLATDWAGNSTAATIDLVLDNLGPRIQNVEMVRQRKTIVSVLVTFNERIDPAGAANPANFVLRKPGKNGRLGKAVSIRGAQLEGVQAVRLLLNKPLKLASALQLTIAHPELLADLAGNVGTAS
jgi:hypothetical protein